MSAATELVTPEYHAKTVSDLVDHLGRLEDWDTKELHILPRQYGDVLQIIDTKLDGREVMLIYVGSIQRPL